MIHRLTRWVLVLVLFVSTSASAELMRFTYKYSGHANQQPHGNGALITVSFDGTLQPDGDTIVVNQIYNAVLVRPTKSTFFYPSIEIGEFAPLPTGSTSLVSISGNTLNIGVCPSGFTVPHVQGGPVNDCAYAFDGGFGFWDSLIGMPNTTAADGTGNADCPNDPDSGIFNRAGCRVTDTPFNPANWDLEIIPDVSVADLALRDWQSPGDQQILHDASTDLEWLRLFVYAGNSLLDLEAQPFFDPAATNGNFRWATNDEVIGLMNNLSWLNAPPGSTGALGVDVPLSDAQGAETWKWIQLVGWMNSGYWRPDINSSNQVFGIDVWSQGISREIQLGGGELGIPYVDLYTDISESFGSSYFGYAFSPDLTPYGWDETRGGLAMGLWLVRPAYGDQDGDGIDRLVDTQPVVASDDFDDGQTSGTINNRGDQTLSITDEAAPDGVRIAADAAGGPTAASISACSGTANLSYSAGDDSVVTCTSVKVVVIAGAVEMIVDVNGEPALVVVPADNEVTFEPETSTFTAPPTNTETIIVVTESGEVPVDPGESSVFSTFASLNLEGEIDDDEIEIEGSFRLGADSDGIDPLSEDVTVEADGHVITIPAGSFTKQKKTYRFNGYIGGAEVEAKLKEKKNGKYKIEFEAEDIDAGESEHFPVTVTIGNDSGSGFATDD